MKFVSILSISSLASTLAFVVGLASNTAVLPLFAVAAASLVLLVLAHDYRSRRDLAACTTIALRPCQTLPLAA
jgi:hypothetical protein